MESKSKRWSVNVIILHCQELRVESRELEMIEIVSGVELKMKTSSSIMHCITYSILSDAVHLFFEEEEESYGICTHRSLWKQTSHQPSNFSRLFFF